jgi:hypothetical protein
MARERIEPRGKWISKSRQAMHFRNKLKRVKQVLLLKNNFTHTRVKCTENDNARWPKRHSGVLGGHHLNLLETKRFLNTI